MFGVLFVLKRMNGYEIERGLKDVLGDNIIFLGCYWMEDASSILRSAVTKSRPCVIILNTIKKNAKEGLMGHWISIYINYGNLTLGYFDSYNLEPELYSRGMSKFLRDKPWSLYKLSYRIQGISSLVCGVYTMYYVYLLSRHSLKKSFAHIHKKFKKHQYKNNDKLILRIAYKIFHMPVCEKTFCLRASINECRPNYCDHLGRS